jgi:hypothetical protein
VPLRLGCKILRTLVSTPLEVVKQSLPYAEEANVKIALEVHFTNISILENRSDPFREDAKVRHNAEPFRSAFLNVIQAFFKPRRLVSDNYEKGINRDETFESVSKMKNATEADKAFAESLI